MSSLKETKARIALVGNTLKITSAMKMVASAKLHKAQQAIESMLPYEKSLHRILDDVLSCVDASKGKMNFGGEYSLMRRRGVRRVAIVAFSSDSSLCGSFNSSVARKVQGLIEEYRSVGVDDSCITVYSIGRKVSEALSKWGFDCDDGYSSLSGTSSYEACAGFADALQKDFLARRFDEVLLVYNHFKSVASQPTCVQTYLPLSLEDVTSAPRSSKDAKSNKEDMPRPANPEDFIIEPDAVSIIKELLPKVVKLQMFVTLLDSNAAEHAARTVAMQNATDNGNDLLDELTLEYNKARQQKITNEILDIVGGSLQ